MSVPFLKKSISLKRFFAIKGWTPMITKTLLMAFCFAAS